MLVIKTVAYRNIFSSATIDRLPWNRSDTSYGLVGKNANVVNTCRRQLLPSALVNDGCGSKRFFLEKIWNCFILSPGCARRGVSGALYPKSAYAGLNPHSRILIRTGVGRPTGRRATGGHEPRQIRKEAAISDAACVVDRSRSF